MAESLKLTVLQMKSGCCGVLEQVRVKGDLLLWKGRVLIHHSLPQQGPRAVYSQSARDQAWWEEKVAVGWKHVDDGDIDSDGGTMMQQSAMWEVTAVQGEGLSFWGLG